MIVQSLEPVTLVGGNDSSHKEITTALTHAPCLVAADGGARILATLGLRPKAVIGDLDSLGDKARRAFSDRLHKVAEQDTTDFEKALREIDAPFVLAVGFIGGRLDHTLATLNVMARFVEKRVVAIGPKDVSFMPTGETALSLPAGSRLSMMPLGECWVDTDGLRWEVVDQKYSPTGAVSISNEVARGEVRIKSKGPLLITLPVAALPAAIAAVRG